MHSKIIQAILSHSENTPNKIALSTVDGSAITYQQLKEKIEAAAAYLTDSGLCRGDRIILSAQKDVEFIFLYFGAHLCGVINVIVDAKNNAEHLGYIASLVSPSLAFGADVDGCKSISFSDVDFSNKVEEVSAGDCDENEAADIMFTSGTTGKPKGVVLSHHNIFSSASYINRFIGNNSKDVELLGLPICHSFGLGRLRCNMLTGATVVLHNGFANLKSVFSAFEKYNVTGFGMVPAVWAYIKRFSGTRIAKYAPQMHYIEIGSASMPLEDKKLLVSLFPDTRICMHYGLTEASRSVFMEFHENEGDLTTAGKSLVPEVDVKILKDDGSSVDVGEEGEICVRGDMVMKSYFLPADNANAFHGSYFRTGDWGYKSSDGNLYLVARKKELINVGGKKVSPIEIEDALERIGIGEAMCVAMPDPEGVLGEVPKALLVKGSFSKSIEDIRRELASLLETYKMPKVFEIVESIPKTASGKKKRTI